SDEWATTVGRSLILVYLIAQGAILLHGHVTLPYVNGANDNATGVALALALADRLWRNPVSGWQVEVVITGSEEVSLVGAKVYVERHLRGQERERVAVLNIDTCGLGEVHAISGEGLLIEPVDYHGPLLAAARRLSAEVPVVAYRW